MMRLLLALICGLTYSCVLMAQVPASDERDLVDVTLERVNQFKVNNQNDSALYELMTLNRTLKKIDQESGYVYIDIGNIYFQLKLDEMARKFYQKADAIFKASDDRIGQAIVLENYGSILSRRSPAHDSVKIYYEQALLLQQEANDAAYAAHSLRALALYCSNLGQQRQAKQLIRRAISSLPLNQLEQHPRYRWDVQFIPQQIFLTASDIYRNDVDNPDSAELFIQEALRMTERHGIAPHRVRYLTFLGTYYLEQQQWSQALTAIRESLALADSIGYVWGKVGALQVLRNYYHQTKDAQKEAEAGYQYLQYKDKMYNEQNNDELLIMSNLILQYENELEIERQQRLVKEKEQRIQFQRQQNMILIGMLAFVALALATVVWLYRSVKSKNRIIEQYYQELGTSNETLRTLLSVISHDVRAPFNSLMGLTNILLTDKNLPPEEHRQIVAMTYETASKGLILLDNLLQWVALQRDKTLIKKEQVVVADIADETLSELASVALTQNTTIEKNIPDISLQTDRNALKTIIRNLLTNAIKYSQGKTVFLSVVLHDDCVLIAVADQGPGIREDILESLFAEGDMKKVMAKGGGLGMQIVKQLVHDLGGNIRAHNLHEGGARFEVSLPKVS